MVKKMKFSSQYDKHERVYSNPGDPIKIIYAGSYDENGKFELVEKGKENLYDYIQSNAESCDIYNILARFENGDETALNKVSGTYGDVTKMPKTYAEMLQTIYNAENTFNALPVELKQLFNNSSSEFIAQMDSPEMAAKFEKFNKMNQSVQNVVQSSNLNENITVESTDKVE